MGEAYMGTCSQGFGGQKEPRKFDIKVSLDVLLTEVIIQLLLTDNLACANFQPGTT
jgi:hypothetical protein